MRAAVICEFSGRVRDALLAVGIDAVSVDLLPSETPGPHHQGDALAFLRERERELDLVIAHPPCTSLTVAGARWFKGREAEQAEAIAFVEAIWSTEVPRVAIENPIGVLSTRSTLGKPTQIIQPWQFGHGETKATCLWLRGLSSLTPTNIVDGRVPRVHHASPGPDRWKERSRTLPGIAEAMAQQWAVANA